MRVIYGTCRCLGGSLLLIALAGCTTTSPVATASPSSVASPSAATVSAAPSTAASPSHVASPGSNAPAPSTVPGSAQAAPETAGAIQTILDYFRAINDQAYAQAYQLWADNGAASTQTLDQFTQGFAGTARVDVQFGTIATTSDGRVNIPITLVSIVNDPANPQNGQRVLHFAGAYTLEPAPTYPNGWQIADANVAEASPAPLPAPADDAVKLVQDYYDAINRGAYAEAYADWSDLGRASQQSFAQFAQGFAATKNVTLDLGNPQSGGAAGSIYVELPVIVHATQQNGSPQTFCGTYTLRRLNVPPFDQLGWHIEGARIAAIDNVPPGSDQARQLVSNGCRQ